ncbi:MAG: HprK-related kinase A [Paraglaciecola sp.]|jgi:HprK-related kinase A
MSSHFVLDLPPFSFAVHSDIAQVKSNLSIIYEQCLSKRDQQLVDYEISMVKSSGIRRFFRPQARFMCDQNEPFKPLDFQKSYAFLEWGMNWTVTAYEVQHLIIHSAVLAKGDKAVLFPAPSGSGKSTLTAYLAFNGWRLLSDEMALIIPNTRTVTPFVRPICLKNQSIDITKDLFPDGKFSDIAKDTHKGDVIHLSPPKTSWDAHKQNAELVAVVFPNYRADTDLQIYQLDKSQAFMQLVENAVNYSVLRNIGFSTLTNLIEGIQTFEIFHNNLSDVQAFLEEEVLVNG